MIFITVGTTPFPLLRMNEVLEYLLKTRRKSEKIIYQHGNTPIGSVAKNIELYPSLPFDKIQEYIKSARIIVCHGGPATIYQCLYAGKKPFVLPREKKFREHVNDHQIVFTDFLTNQNLIYKVTLQNLNFSHKMSPVANYMSKSCHQLCNFLDEIVVL